MEFSQEERAESIMREAFLWGQLAGPILGGCLVWGRSGPSMVFSRAVLSACLASLLVPAAWRGPSHVALRLFQGLCTVSLYFIFKNNIPSKIRENRILKTKIN